MFCKDCGQKVHSYQEFCKRCGADLFSKGHTKTSDKHSFMVRFFRKTNPLN
jgi:hypothetical protein